MTVIALSPRRCWDCTHSVVHEDERGLVSSVCEVVNEPLDDERIAVECPDFVLDQLPRPAARKPGHSLPVRKEDTHV